MTDDSPPSQQRLGLAILICVHIVLCCVSLFYIAHLNYPGSLNPALFHMLYDPARLPLAVLAVASFAPVSLLFVFSRFSFGYFSGFYFYTMIAGYLWLNCFSDLKYDHRSAGLSAAVSAAAFLLPALLISSPMPQVYVLSERGLENLLRLILSLAIVTVLVGATYNFRLVSLENIYDFRGELKFPAFVRYSVGITSSALLPFAFACFVTRREYWRSGAVILLLLLIYPITLGKLSLLAPAWLVAFVFLSRFLRARFAVILSLLLPVLAGVVLIVLLGPQAMPYLATVNFRMLAITSSAMDVYNDFFSRHEVTYFCQIAVLKPIMHCPYQDPLSVVMQTTYKIGNFNASLFATEGVASVGIWLAPVSAFICGLVIALGNRLSAGLPAGFILISGAVMIQVLLNVPLTTAMLTHGAGLLFLLWYVTPRTMFEQHPASEPSWPASLSGEPGRRHSAHH